MDYCPGGDLANLIEEKGRLHESDARFYFGEVILAFEYIHNFNIFYRDLKPANILIDDEGHVKLADFGLAKEGVNQ